MGFTSINVLEALTSFHILSSLLWICGLLGWETYQGQSNYMIEDLAKGLEKTPIPVVFSDVGLPSFQYINTSMVHDQACVKQTLSCLGEGSYCSCPAQDCLTTNGTCVCATTANGGKFAYRAGGFLTDVFLQRRINEAHECTSNLHCCCTELQHVEAVVTCGVHKSAAFISECNAKCGCRSDCGNRVVQQGMRYAVEVFRTTHTGWGIRARGRIPRGAFVFEMTGEILTNAEQILRNRGIRGGPSYSMQIDADWAAERVLDNNTALCLDASNFGNVARFLNHRCVSLTYHHLCRSLFDQL